MNHGRVLAAAKDDQDAVIELLARWFVSPAEPA